MRKRHSLELLAQNTGSIVVIHKHTIINIKLASHKLDSHHTIPIALEQPYPMAVGIRQHQNHGSHLRLAVRSLSNEFRPGYQ